jgi:transketolase
MEAMSGVRGAVSVEDHQINGALGSALSECFCEHGGARLSRLGLRDVFPESGDPDPLLDKYGMSIQGIVAEARRTASKD